MLSTPNSQPHQRPSQANDPRAQQAGARGGNGPRKTLSSYKYKNILLSLGVFGLSIGLSGLLLKQGADGFEQSYFILSYQQPAWYGELDAEVDSVQKNSLSKLQDTITSELILSQVVAQVKDSYPDITVEELGNQLTVKTIEPSHVDLEKAAGEVSGAIRVELNDRDREKAQLILSVLQKTYLNYYQQKQQVDFIQVTSSFDEQLRENLLAAGELELKLAELYRRHPFLSQGAITDQGKIAAAEKTLQQNRDQLRSELDNYQQQLASLRSGQKEPALNLQDGSSFQGALVLDQKINAIEQQYNSHLSKYNQTPSQFNNLNPSTLDQAPPKILSPQTNNSLFILRNVAPDTGQIQQELDGEIKTRSLVSKIEEIKAQLTTLDATIAELPNLRYQSQQWQVELENLQKKQDELIARQQELEASKSKLGSSLQLSPTEGDSNIVIPQENWFWQITLIKVLLSAGLAYLAYRYLNQIDFEIETIEDIEAVLGGPPIAAIPKIQLNPHKSNPRNHYTTAPINPPSLGHSTAFSQEITTIAEGLIHHQQQNPQLNAIAITSSFAGEGKSQTIYGVADQLAKDGFNTLILDADLRKPSIHQLGQVSNDSGLTDILTYQYEATIDHIIKPSTTNPNLKILPSGPLPINPLTLLNNPTMVGLLRELKAQYDFVLIDLPPIICIEDMKLIMNQCDGIFVSCRLGRSTYKSLMYCLEQINQYQGNILGVIANFCSSGTTAPEMGNLSLLDREQHHGQQTP
ncbi:MAG: polysaccharide biosynthesis tyrosine autokinase [Synechococcaceae cyanobacterium RL_1_2]|nr:polysaccharide biosynthesis tyrosine autokinase [Synechococcaceae cyanobacterium RL_1_2]